MSVDEAARLEAMTFTRPQARVVDAARELFAEHGVSGTSLLMIAERLGFTKAAVYYQFKTKEEIVVAVATTEMLGLEEILDAADEDPDRAREQVLDRMVTFVVERRRRALLIQTDPMMVRLLSEHRPFDDLLRRLQRLLTGEDTPMSRARCAMLGAAIDAALTHPLVVQLDDDELRVTLLGFAYNALGIRQPSESGATIH